MSELTQAQATPPTRKLRGALRALCEGANRAHLATILPDGSPHSVPVWIGVEGERVAFLTGPGSRKARNIARSSSGDLGDRPRAALYDGHDSRARRRPD